MTIKKAMEHGLDALVAAASPRLPEGAVVAVRVTYIAPSFQSGGEIMTTTLVHWPAAKDGDE